MSTTSLRTCVGCRTVTSPDQLVRVTTENTADGPRVVADLHRRLGGRGAWVHATRQCVDRAVRKRAFNRSFRTAVTAQHLTEQLRVLLPAQEGEHKESESEDHGKPMSAGR
ncbi:YlxR family protein [Kocuria tytonis]|uniref:YlxR family protein n=1 Tax=Kocuria tytonis TaxID=2054280 RepID=A0A495A248_9MICC|nr:YlxR family protein [Kocuria tytonis]RKQ33356.1 YlxR family protein [Kocuria tytonis]